MTRLVKGTKVRGRLKGLTSGKGKKKGLKKQIRRTLSAKARKGRTKPL